MENKIVNCNGIEISNKNKICLIAGPCQLETEQHALDMAGKIKEITTKYNIGFIYKTSFDKANRTSLKGKRGTEGKIEAIRYARERKIPFLGICFGMQMAMIEFARNILKIKKAGSSELDKNCFPVIGLIDEWNKDGKIIK